MKIVRICMAILATMTFATIAAGQCGPARPKTPTGAGSLDEMVIAQEKLVIEAIRKRDKEAFQKLIDTTGVVVDRNGIRKISEVLPELFAEGITFSEWTVEDPKVKLIEKNTAMLTYKSSVTMTMSGKTITGTSFETTLFERRAGKWVGWFHQSSDMAPANTAEGSH